MNNKKIIVVVVAIALISAIVYAIYYFTQNNDSKTGSYNDGIKDQNEITEGDLPELVNQYYDEMMDAIMTPVGVGQGTYKTYPLVGWYETLSPSFYSGYPAEFDNVVQKRIDGLIEMKNSGYLVAGAITKPGALIDAYAEVGGSLFMDEATTIFNEFKTKYLDGIGN